MSISVSTYRKLFLTSSLALTLALSTAGHGRGLQRSGGVGRCADSRRGSGDTSPLMNIAGTPLELKITENKRHILLSNVSPVRVVGYKLGAVAYKKGVPVLVRVSARIEVSLDVHEAAINPKVVEDELDYCRRKKAKLAVVEVIFADGSVWLGKI
jgi:hypothetical protein